METTPEGWEFWEESLKTNPERADTQLPLEVADAILQYAPESVVHRIGCPILYVSAALDCLTALEEQLSLYRGSPEPKSHVIVQDADHHGVYKEPYLTRLMELSIEWFKRYLPAGC